MQHHVVLGGAGFVGSHLVDALLRQGNSVTVVDNLSTGKLQNLAHLTDRSDFNFICADICDGLPDVSSVDVVYNLASPASPAAYERMPLETLRVGAIGTLNSLEFARRLDATYFLASTSEVYGDPLVSPQSEDYWGNVNPIGPRSVYDEAKRFAEAAVVASARTHAVDVRIARLFNTYGPRMRLNDGRVLPAFIGQALRGEDLTIFGDGSQTRSFCFVDDLIEGIHRLLMSDYTQPMNIGNPDEITIKQFCEEIIKLTGTKQKIVYRELPQDDPKQRRPDINKAKMILNWSPKVDRAEGLKITYEYFKSLPESDLAKIAHKDFTIYNR